MTWRIARKNCIPRKPLASQFSTSLELPPFLYISSRSFFFFLSVTARSLSPFTSTFNTLVEKNGCWITRIPIPPKGNPPNPFEKKKGTAVTTMLKMHSLLVTLSSLLLTVVSASAGSAAAAPAHSSSPLRRRRRKPYLTSTGTDPTTLVTAWQSTVTPTAPPTNPAPSNTAFAVVTPTRPLPPMIVVAVVISACALVAVCSILRFCYRRYRRRKWVREHNTPLDEGFFQPTSAMGHRHMEEGTGRWSIIGPNQVMTVEEKVLGGPPYEISPAAPTAERSQFLQIKYVPSRPEEHSPPPQPPMAHNRSESRGVSTPVRGSRE